MNESSHSPATVQASSAAAERRRAAARRWTYQLQRVLLAAIKADYERPAEPRQPVEHPLRKEQWPSKVVLSRLLLELVARYNPDPQGEHESDPWMLKKTIAASVGLSVKRAVYGIRALEELGYIRRHERPGRSNVFEILIGRLDLIEGRKAYEGLQAGEESQASPRRSRLSDGEVREVAAAELAPAEVAAVEAMPAEPARRVAVLRSAYRAARRTRHPEVTHSEIQDNARSLGVTERVVTLMAGELGISWGESATSFWSSFMRQQSAWGDKRLEELYHPAYFVEHYLGQIQADMRARARRRKAPPPGRGDVSLGAGGDVAAPSSSWARTEPPGLASAAEAVASATEILRKLSGASAA